MHWLPGPIAVRAGEVLPLTACHNTVGFRFEVGRGVTSGRRRTKAVTEISIILSTR